MNGNTPKQIKAKIEGVNAKWIYLVLIDGRDPFIEFTANDKKQFEREYERWSKDEKPALKMSDIRAFVKEPNGTIIERKL